MPSANSVAESQQMSWVHSRASWVSHVVILCTEYVTKGYPAIGQDLKRRAEFLEESFLKTLLVPCNKKATSH